MQGEVTHTEYLMQCEPGPDSAHPQPAELVNIPNVRVLLGGEAKLKGLVVGEGYVDAEQDLDTSVWVLPLPEALSICDDFQPSNPEPGKPNCIPKWQKVTRNH